MPPLNVVPSSELIALLRHERTALADLATGKLLPAVLEGLAGEIEKTNAGVRVSVLLLSDDRKHLLRGAGPSFPPDFWSEMSDVEIGPLSGSCGTAAFYNDGAVYTSDIASDERWNAFRDVAVRHNLKACWSNPVKAMDGRLIGTVALYFSEVKPPSGQLLDHAAIMTHMAALAIERHGMDEALRASEDHYRHAVNLNPQVVWTATPDGQLDYVGPRWFEWTGGTGLGNSWAAAVHPDDLDASYQAWIHSCQTGEIYDIEHRAKLASGTYHWMHSRAFARRDGQGTIVKWYGSTEDIEDRWQAVKALEQREAELLELNVTLEDQVRARTDELTALTRHLQSAQEEERSRLASELHDELGAIFTTAKMDAVRLKARLGPLEPDAELRLAHMIETLNMGVDLKRRIIEDLRPSALSNLGLVQALQILTNEFSRTSGLELDCAFDEVKLTPSAQLTVYRLVQEALANVAKYARARLVSVTLVAQEPDQAQVLVSDDGVGFDGTVRRGGAHGLSGIRYRVEAERGVFSIDSVEGLGTRISASLPLLRDFSECGGASRSAPLE